MAQLMFELEKDVFGVQPSDPNLVRLRTDLQTGRITIGHVFSDLKDGENTGATDRIQKYHIPIPSGAFPSQGYWIKPKGPGTRFRDSFQSESRSVCR